ncbi:hypothetical protein [Bradyrhizobium sp. HKCCYLRH3059]|uniref:hypothetical protein n=1 Tax=unclassified Bradyrhizobium TaxID=2631580 RepID=UPI003EBD0FEC
MSEVFIRGDDSENLETFALYLFSRLNVRFVEIRESSFYVNNTYIVGEALGMMVKLSLADDTEFNDYRYWLTFSAPSGLSEGGHGSLDGVAELVAGVLALEGLETARSLGGGLRIGEPKRLYRREVRSDGPGYVLRTSEA